MRAKAIIRRRYFMIHMLKVDVRLRGPAISTVKCLNWSSSELTGGRFSPRLGGETGRAPAFSGSRISDILLEEASLADCLVLSDGDSEAAAVPVKLGRRP